MDKTSRSKRLRTVQLPKERPMLIRADNLYLPIYVREAEKGTYEEVPSKKDEIEEGEVTSSGETSESESDSDSDSGEEYVPEPDEYKKKSRKK